MKIENGNFNLTSILSLLSKPFLSKTILQFAVDQIVHKFEKRHPNIIYRMQVFKKSIIALEPNDLPFAFVASFHPSFKIKIVNKNSIGGDIVSLKAPLNIFLDMLFSSEDGDALFFARKLEVRGDTTSIVALRNIIEAENLSLEEDMQKEFGIFNVLIKTLIGIYKDIDTSLKEVKTNLVKEIHDNVSYSHIKIDRLENEVRNLKLSLHKTSQKLAKIRLKEHE